MAAMYTKKETTEVVASYQHTTTSYQCSVCQQEFDDEDDVKHHYGETHAVKDTRSAGGQVFHRFDAKEDFDAYVNYRVKDEHIDYVYAKHVSGVGWFTFERGSERCSRNCCYKDTLTATALENIRAGIEHSLQSTVDQLADIDAMIAKVKGQEIKQ